MPLMSAQGSTQDELLKENRRLRAALRRERRAADRPSAPIEAGRGTGGASGGGASGPKRRPGEDLFREAFQLGPAALAVTRLSDGTFVEVNERFLNATGYERDELIGHSSIEREIWPSERLRRLTVERLREHGEILDVEFQLCTRKGRKRSMLGSCRHLVLGGDDCLLVSCIDVTERNRAETAREESEELFRRLFRLSPAGLTLTRLSDGRITDVNPEFCRLCGYERAEIVGQSWGEMALWEDEERRRELARRLKEEAVVQDFEFTIAAKDGWPIELMGAFQHLTVKGEACILSVLSDISARKRAERSLREAKQEAEDLAQFRSNVIANITHEVRTPLTVILGFTSILREGVDGPHRRFVDLIERSGRRLLTTLDSVLDLAQLESGTLEVDAQPHNVLDIIDSVAGETRSVAEEKGLDFETELPEQALYAEVDYELLARALDHLVDNAVKFTDEGNITLRARTESSSTDGREDSTDDREEQVLIEVVDTGVGIHDQFIPDLFSVFSQESSGMDRDYQGSGMGLPVAARLIERFDGEVQVETQKGAGSTFTIVLPQTEAAPSSNRTQRAQVA
jgi:PAS domain S-box-containing protein